MSAAMSQPAAAFRALGVAPQCSTCPAGRGPGLNPQPCRAAALMAFCDSSQMGEDRSQTDCWLTLTGCRGWDSSEDVSAPSRQGGGRLFLSRSDREGRGQPFSLASAHESTKSLRDGPLSPVGTRKF